MQITRSLLARYFRGQCTAGEQEAVQAFIAAGTDATLVEAGMEEAWQGLPLLPLSEEEHTAAWRQFTAKSGWKPARVRRLHWLRYAAVIAVLLCSLGIWQAIHHSTQHEVMAQTIQAVAGVPKRVTLTDGSTVYLFPGTSLTVPAQFNQQQRKVQLKGRAFFDIMHSAKPFSVQSAGLTTNVLGTSFEVTPASVTVYTGRVAVRKGDKTLSQLTPGQQLRYNKGRFTVEQAGTLTNSWISGELAFNETPLPEVCAMLEQWYGVRIQLDGDKWRHKKVSVKFRGQVVDTVLHVLSLTTGFQYTTTHEQISIY